MGVKERIKQFCKAKRMSVVDFEASIGASNGYVNSISKSVGLEKLKYIIEVYPNLDLKWLFTGEGSMEVEEKYNDQHSDIDQSYILELQKKYIKELEENVYQLKKENTERNVGYIAAENDAKLDYNKGKR